MKILTAAALIAAIAVAGCSTKEEPKPDPNANANTNVNNTGPAPDSVEYFTQVVGNRVFFATDQYDLDSQAVATLDRQAEWLSANAGTTVTIEGHADERGTRQYNLALGARRANAVRQYLIGRGIESGRVRAVTFGKERPEAVCSDDSCWSQNRRAITAVTGAPGS